MLSVCSIHSRQILVPSRFLGSFLIDSRHISRFIEVILCAFYQLDSFLICQDPLTCIVFHMFCIFLLSCHPQHLVSLHSCIYMDSLCPLIILDHLYVSQVKLYSFLYPLSIMTKKGRKCGFLLRFYMLGGKMHVLKLNLMYLNSNLNNITSISVFIKQ